MYRIGNRSGNCVVNWAANGRCLLVEGRRFVDAVAFTGLVGWYGRSKQLFGVVYFEDGDSLLMRATVPAPGPAAQPPLKGAISGMCLGKPVDVSFVATRAKQLWTVEIRMGDDTVVKGVLGSPQSQP